DFVIPRKMRNACACPQKCFAPGSRPSKIGSTLRKWQRAGRTACTPTDIGSRVTVLITNQLTKILVATRRIDTFRCYEDRPCSCCEQAQLFTPPPVQGTKTNRLPRLLE